MREIDRVVADYSRVVRAKDARIEELERENERLREALGEEYTRAESYRKQANDLAARVMAAEAALAPTQGETP